MRDVYGEYVSRQNIKNEERAAKRDDAYEVLLQNLDGIRKYCEENNQDWPIIICGAEGTGKSTLAIQCARHLDKDFKMSENLIYSYAEGDLSLNNFMKKYMKTPFKAPVYDEAVTFMFSQKHAEKESKDSQVIFKLKRECKHFDILVVQSFWDMLLDIRERRAKLLLYTYADREKKGDGSYYLVHKFAFYTASEMVQLSESKSARRAFRNHAQLFKIVPPVFSGTFPDLPIELQREYKDLKWANMSNFLDKAFGAEGKTARVGIEKSFDYSDFEEKYCKG